MGKLVRYLQTFHESGAVKYVAGKFYEVLEETEHHVRQGLAELVEFDVEVRDAEKAAAAALEASAKAAAAAATAEALKLAAQAAQELADAATARLKAKKDGKTKKLATAVSAYLALQAAAAQAFAQAREAEALAAIERGEDDLPIPAKVKEERIAAAKVARAAEVEASNKVGDARAKLDELGTPEEIENVTAALAAKE